MALTSVDLRSIIASASVAPSIYSLRPDYRVHLVAASNIESGPCDDHSEALLLDAESTARTLLVGKAATALPHIESWRNAYKTFGAKPNKTRNSLEALTRRLRADGSGSLPRINRLTDIYNAISVKHQIPLGGEDLSKYVGSPRLIRAEGSEVFEINSDGRSVIENPIPGEPVWCDDVGVTCRIWNWRQGPRTALTQATTSVLFILDALGPCSNGELQEGARALVQELKALGAEVVVAERLISA